jgi:hypothetical protein
MVSKDLESPDQQGRLWMGQTRSIEGVAGHFNDRRHQLALTPQPPHADGDGERTEHQDSADEGFFSTGSLCVLGCEDREIPNRLQQEAEGKR